MTENLNSNKIGKSKILRLSMDGPNVDWEFHNLLQKQICEAGEDESSCGHMFTMHSRLECRTGPLIFILAICRLTSTKRRFY